MKTYPFWILEFKKNFIDQSEEKVRVFFMQPDMDFADVLNGPPDKSPEWAPTRDRSAATPFDSYDSAWLCRAECDDLYDDLKIVKVTGVKKRTQDGK